MVVGTCEVVSLTVVSTGEVVVGIVVAAVVVVDICGVTVVVDIGIVTVVEVVSTVERNCNMFYNV